MPWGSSRRSRIAKISSAICPKNAEPPMLISHGDDTGPKQLRFSAEDGYQRRHGHGNAVWLSAF